MDEELETEKTKVKSWIYVLIIFVSVGGIAWFIYSIYLSFKALGQDLSTNTFYVLELTDYYKDDIISILNRENRKYCESIYKIEYKALIPNDYSAVIYCKDQANINFTITDNEKSELIKYIHDNGTTERRK